MQTFLIVVSSVLAALLTIVLVILIVCVIDMYRDEWAYHIRRFARRVKADALTAWLWARYKLPRRLALWNKHRKCKHAYGDVKVRFNTETLDVHSVYRRCHRCGRVYSMDKHSVMVHKRFTGELHITRLLQ